MLNLFLNILFLSLTALAVPKAEHAIYLAVIQLDHANKASIAKLSIKVFTDDTRDALRNAFPDAFQPVETADFCVRNADQLNRYFQQHFTCRINEKKMAFTLKKGTLQNDVYLLEFEMECPEQWKKLEAEASFFMELFPTQSNVLQIIHGEEKGYFRLTKKATSCTLDFD